MSRNPVSQAIPLRRKPYNRFALLLRYALSMSERLIRLNGSKKIFKPFPDPFKSRRSLMPYQLQCYILKVGFFHLMTLTAAILLLHVTVQTALSETYEYGRVIFSPYVDILFFHESIDFMKTDTHRKYSLSDF